MQVGELSSFCDMVLKPLCCCCLPFSRAGILARCLQRMEWDKAQEAAAQQEADERERERMAMLSIDWHEFVVVETIDFFEDEDEELPPPLTLKEVLLLNKQQGEELAKAAEEGFAAPEAGGEAMQNGMQVHWGMRGRVNQGIACMLKIGEGVCFRGLARWGERMRASDVDFRALGAGVGESEKMLGWVRNLKP